ncbi:hypothetical protein L195_g012246 [Trifolium pratense]|uniref:Uncharacterized protein n=1 Tax=Trifolium pratense TaxID=57577 RepID=A0A2K3PJT1_TRIPR|nr:hypothetical protein L195_g012246 [Trifolium pratense]
MVAYVDFRRSATTKLLKELLRLDAGRKCDDDGGKVKGGYKVNLAIEGDDKINLVVALHEEIII